MTNEAIGNGADASPGDGSGATLRSLTLDRLQQISRAQLAELLLNAAPELKGDAYDTLISSIEEIERFARKEATPDDHSRHMVGESREIRRVFDIIRRFASVDAPVLLTGESGTGKELAARAIHERSGFADGPFVALNCGGLPDALVASELFGHEKGAFTGAHARYIGRIEQAQNGTLFLDEIGEMPLSLQPQLLRFLQENTICRLGGKGEIPVKTRIIAATNAELETQVKAEAFRADLFFRLNVLRCRLPALRERGDDVILLAKYFLTEIQNDLNTEARLEFSADAMSVIRNHDWPGNVRELIGKLRRAVVMCENTEITAQDLDIVATDATPPAAPLFASGSYVTFGRSESGRRCGQVPARCNALPESNAAIIAPSCFSLRMRQPSGGESSATP